jgi:hypothetical protein
MLMKKLLIAVTFASAGLAPLAHARSFIVENGQPRAEIVIARDPQRTTRVAATCISPSAATNGPASN